MIRRQVDRRRATRGGMTVSMVMHGLLLVLLAILAGRQASQVEAREELVEIAYIEARYGEDVAAKVKMKVLPQLGDGGGVSSRSAMQPEEPSPEPPRPEPPEPAQPEAKPALAEAAEVAAPEIAPVQKPVMQPAPILEAKTFKKSSAPIVDIEDVEDEQVLADIASPEAVKAASSARFRPEQADLKSRNRTALEPRSDSALGNVRSGGPSVATADEGADRLLAGGTLEGRGQTYRAPIAGLASTGGSAGTGRALADITGPAGGSPGGSERSGRRTILDYGNGSGGGGGGLVGRGAKLVEAPRPESVVEEAQQRESKPVEETASSMVADGVSMQISGQISGRKILSSVAPVYTERARKQGWEGVVVVHFTVLPDGRVKDNTYFQQTSAHRDLNRAAMDAIRQFRFASLPAGEMVEQWGLITIIFRLS